MKKKGLIIATIVMVLVLAVSLTTATYAWFTVSDITTIDAFNVSVVANNAVNIGVKKDNTYNASATANDFMNGAVNYTPGAAGTFGGGEWKDGTPGLGATITHNIKWGSQKKAVGITSADAASGATYENTTDIVTNKALTSGTIVAANGVAGGTGALVTPEAAVANYNPNNTKDEDNKYASDYVYLFLGVQPTKTLDTNQLVILLAADADAGEIVGILAAVHVAYRVNGGDWNEVEFFTGNDNAQTPAPITYGTSLSKVNCNLTPDQANAYAKSYTKGSNTVTAPTTGAKAVVIDLGADYGIKAQTDLAQVEIVIYISGKDSDCRNEALGVSGSLSIFFNTKDAAVQG